MEVFVCNTYKEMSESAAIAVTNYLEKLDSPLICTASGDSPAGLYKELKREIGIRNLDISKWHFVGLDEWAGMNSDTEGSCRYHLNQQLFDPLAINENNICFFDGTAKSLETECKKVEEFISGRSGIDLAIVGLGLNGHIGMNEPGTSPDLRTHIAEIDITTQITGQKYFKTSQNLERGLTLGIANLMEARQVILMVSGTKKASILKRIVEEQTSPPLPAQILKEHKNLKIYLDAEAGAFLQKS